MNDWFKSSTRKMVQRFGFEIYRTREPSGARAHSFDHTFQRLMAMRTLGFYPATICDIGASDGRWSRRCQEIFPNAEYFCVEPLGENQPLLEQFSAKHPNVHYWQGCLGTKRGVVTLNVDGDGSSILPGHNGNPYGTQREVKAETLDGLILRGMCPQPDLIKLDVQGYELEVLKGATNALSKVQAIVAEVSFLSFQKGMPVFHEVVEQLAEYGFAVYDLLSLSSRPFDRAPAQADLLFLQSTHALRNSNKWDHNSVY